MGKITPLRKNKEFNAIYRRGRKRNGGLMALVYIPSGNCLRQGYSISKKVGNSVVRNKVRRRMKEAMRLMAEDIKNASVVFVARPAIAQADYHEIRACMIRLLSEAELLKKQVI